MDQERESDDAPIVSADSTRKWKDARRRSLIGLSFIAAVSLIGLIFVWLGHPTSNTLRFELAKTFMQGLAVAFLGGLVTLATFSFQNSRAEEDEAIRRAEDNKDRKVRRAQDKKEIARAERLRQDDQLRSIMEETLGAYNRVKRIRRLLEAETNDGTSGCLTLAVYDRYMHKLIDEQLEFERLKRFTPFINDERLNQPPADSLEQSWEAPRSQTEGTLEETYEGIERYLNYVIGEYEKKRHTVADKDSVALTEFDILSGFIGTEFIRRVADRMDEVIETLQKALWQPLDSRQDRNLAADISQ
jgi:hypothetical protein